MDRYLVVRIPLQDSDPFDIISAIDRNGHGDDFLGTMMKDRFSDVLLSVETGDKVH